MRTEDFTEMSAVEIRQWLESYRQSEQGRAGRRAFERQLKEQFGSNVGLDYGVLLQGDGCFRIDDVASGDYWLDVWVFRAGQYGVDYDKPLGPAAEKFNRGCVSQSSLWGFHAALSFFNKLGVSKIEKRVRHLSGYLIDGLKELGVKVNTPLEPSERGGLVTYTTGRHELNVKSHNTFQRKGIITALRYQNGVGGIRVSTHFFNTEDEVDQLLGVQRNLLT